MRWASTRTLPCGSPAKRRNRKNGGRAEGVRPQIARDAEQQPVSVKQVALSLPETHGKSLPGGREPENNSVALRRRSVRPAHGIKRSEPYPEEWLLIEWPSGEAEPAKYWLSTLRQRPA